MRGPPGSRAPKPSLGGSGGDGASAHPSASARGKAPKKASRLLLYLRLRRRELLRAFLLACAAALLLLLVLWVLFSFPEEEPQSSSASEGAKTQGSLHKATKQRTGGRPLLRRRRGSALHIFSGMGKFRGGGVGRQGKVGGSAPLPIVRNPYASTSSLNPGALSASGLMSGHGTDVYEASRAEEVLGKWDRELGLEVDTWDPRTHDPSHPDLGALGKVVQQKAKAQQQQGHGQNRGSAKQQHSGSAVPPPPPALPKPRYLTIVTFNRLFADDPSNVSAYECVQWVEYYKYAGASHVLWYDTSDQPNNPVFREMKPYVDMGFVTYLRFSAIVDTPGHEHGNEHEHDMHEEQDQTTIHALTTFGPTTTWLAPLDVDEYVFGPEDTRPGFLERYLRIYEGRNPEATQLLLQSFLFIGNPEAPLPALLIERYTQRSAESEGASLQPESMMKPLLRPEAVHLVYWQHPQHMEMAWGKTMALPASALRINHYWGPRLPDWEFRKKLLTDDKIKGIAEQVRHLLRKRQKKSFWSRRSLVAL